MRRLEIRKGSKVRVCYAPGQKEKAVLRSMVSGIMEQERKAARAAKTSHVAHGFIAGRSPVTCAMCHRGFAVTVSVDLSGWFDSVRADQITLGDNIKKLIIVDGAPRQGLPTSPPACNLAAVPMDRAVLDALAKLDCRTAYTRYADDMTVSASDPDAVPEIMAILRACVEVMGWKLAEHKSYVQYATAGRRVIVGVAVDDKVQATRKTRRKLRAAKHRGPQIKYPVKKGTKQPKPHSPNRANGLSEWAACKLPKAARVNRRVLGVNSFGGMGRVEANQQVSIQEVSTVGSRKVVTIKPKGSLDNDHETI